MNYNHKIQNIRSSVDGKMPQIDQLLYGEIAVNFHKDNEFLCIKSTDGTQDNDVIVSFRTWPYIQTVIQNMETNLNDKYVQLEATVLNNEEITSSSLSKINESCGFNENIEFTPSTDAYFIGESTTVTEALNILDEIVADNDTKLATSVNDLQTVADKVNSSFKVIELIENNNNLEKSKMTLSEEELNSIRALDNVCYLKYTVEGNDRSKTYYGLIGNYTRGYSDSILEIPVLSCGIDYQYMILRINLNNNEVIVKMLQLATKEDMGSQYYTISFDGKDVVTEEEYDKLIDFADQGKFIKIIDGESLCKLVIDSAFDENGNLVLFTRDITYTITSEYQIQR